MSTAAGPVVLSQLPRVRHNDGRALGFACSAWRSCRPIAEAIPERREESMSTIPAKRLKGLLRCLTYPIQFVENPASDVDRVVDQVVRSAAMAAGPAEYLLAVEVALSSDE